MKICDYHRPRVHTALIAAVLAVILMLPSCRFGTAEPQTPFALFQNVMKTREPYSRTEAGDGGYIYHLDSGVLSIALDSGTEIWRSNADWWITDFRLGDVDGDGMQDVLFTLWKSYRFGAAKPARMENKDDSVRNHLFLYTVMPGYVKEVWCSSALPRPIYSFELDPSGPVTPVSSGMLLRTEEGAYQEDYARTESVACKYVWQGWGFFPEELAVNTATISFTGDLMVHQQQMDDALLKGGGAYDFDYCFAPIRNYLRGSDYTIGNLETTFPGNPSLYSDFPCFGAPDAFGAALKNAGFDMVTTANNHSLDKGTDGLVHTLEVLDSFGIAHVGTYRTQEERDTVFLKNINGITFAFISYTYSTNGIPVPDDKEYLANVMNEQDSHAKLFADIRAAKELNPDFVIVLPHMGDEYRPAPQQKYIDLMNDMCAAGADIVLATHPHVLQPMQFMEVNDKDGASRRCFVAYSLGNFISSQRDNATDAGIILNLTFEKTEGQRATMQSVSYVPTWVQFAGVLGGYDIKVLPVCAALTASEDNNDYHLRAADIDRLKDVLAQTSQMISGKRIGLAEIPDKHHAEAALSLALFASHHKAPYSKEIFT